nr:PQQ-binding-like beta-propeller repeat protein [Halorussus amylolyticus]
MVPSRRRFLESLGVGLAGPSVAGSLGGASVAGVAADGAESGPDSATDWPMARYDPAGTGHHPDASGPKDDVRVAWAHDATDWFLGTTPPIRRGETILAAGHGLLALDAETGARRFGHRGPYRSSPARASTSIYDTDTLAVTAPSGVFGLNAEGGFEVPLLNRSVGAERWAGPESPGGGFFGPPDPATPVAADGTIYTVIPGTNSLGALDPDDGRVRWRTTHHEDDPVSAEFNRPAVKDGLVFLTNWPGQAAAYRADTGERHWRRDLGEQTLHPPVATDEGVVVQSREGVSLLDAADGRTLWERDLDGNVTESAPAVADGAIFAADERGSLHALDIESGESLWTTPFDGQTTPVVADGVVYAVRSEFSLVALDAESGERLFEYRPSQVPLSPPIVGDGVLYAANRERVIALEEAE